MNKNRLETFSDGVIAIIITIMVLELKTPEGVTFASLKPLFPTIVSYALSFIYLAIYWNNHHYLMHTVTRVNGRILWSNIHLLFWLSLIPFCTAWIGDSNFATFPMMLYGFILFMNGVAYYILTQQIIKSHPKDSILEKAVGRDIKGIISIVLYLLALVSLIFFDWLAPILYVIVAIMWVIPDTRIEKFID
jgi:uncharacterized membrane protein